MADRRAAAGVDMGRNIFQSDNPATMILAVGAVVYESLKLQVAEDQFLGERGRQVSPSP